MGAHHHPRDSSARRASGTDSAASSMAPATSAKLYLASMPQPHTSPSHAKSAGLRCRTMRSSSHQAAHAMAVTRMVCVWSRIEYQPSGGSSSMLADAHQAPRGPSSSRPARYMNT